MDNAETLKLMAVLRGAYPNFYRGMSRKEAESVVALWTEMFHDDPYELVAAAVKAFIVTDSKGFPPAIGVIKDKLHQITTPEEMTEGEAWQYVRQALKNGIYGSEKEFSALPERIQRLVGSPEQLREWASMDEGTVQSVVASNVQRTFRAKAQAERDFAALPEDVKALSRVIAGQLQAPVESRKMEALPPKVRTKEDIQADIEKMKSRLLQTSPKKEEVYDVTKVDPVEWERKRKAAIAKLLEVDHAEL